MGAQLTVEDIKREAKSFVEAESGRPEPGYYGIDNGKTIGTMVEHKFRDHLQALYEFSPGNSAAGIDFPELGVDVKVTSAKQPQSSCPFKDAYQKIYGIGYSLLLFVYKKTDHSETQTGTLCFEHCVFIEAERTADYQMTKRIREILANDGNTDDLIGFMHDCLLPVSDIEAEQIARKLLAEQPEQGYLTISNALQWRLQYGRVVELAGKVEGIINLKG
jgi:hypothetical protein